MSAKKLAAAILTGMLGLGLPAATSAQTKTQAAPPQVGSQTQAGKDSKPPAMLPLKDLGVISAAELAREAAKTKARAQGQATSKSSPANEGGTLEFQPVKGGSSSDSPSTDAHLKDQKKPLLKDFHGSVYGATAGQSGAGSTAAGAVGASSPSGKLNVFVEGQHSQASNPGPHQ
jgi:hypothetical protein